jgi:hypothetical protein
MNLGAFLAYQDISCPDVLTPEPFNAEPLPRAVSTVSRTATCFFVRHLGYPSILYFAANKGLLGAPNPSRFDALNAHQAKILPVASRLAIPFSFLVFENQNLFVLVVPHQAADHPSVFKVRLPDIDVFAVRGQKHLVENNRVSHIARELFHPDLMALGYTVLLAACFYDRIHP